MSRTAPILLASTLLTLGCADLGAPTGEENRTDAGAFASDASDVLDASPAAPDRTEDLGGDSCFNFEDENMDGALDCGDVTCRTRTQPACCVGIVSDACCSLESVTREVTHCEGDACLGFEGSTLVADRGTIFNVADTCTSATRVFGPIGDNVTHGRMLLPRVFSPATSFVTLTATLHVGESAEIAAAGFGLVAPQGVGPRVSPVLAVVASASTSELRVIAGDRVIATRPLASGPCDRTLTLVLELAPDGHFTLTRAGGEMAPVTDTYDAVRSARAVMFGQQPNPIGTPDLAWVADLSVATRSCDVTLPARTSEPLVGDTTRDITDFTVYTQPDGEGRDALVAEGGRLYWFDVRSEAGELNSSPAPFATPVPFDGDVRDIDVFEDLSGSLMAVLAVRDATTMRTRLMLARLRYAVGNSVPVLVDATDLIDTSDAESDDLITSFTSVDSPSAIVFDGRVRVAFRAHEDGRTSLRIATINGSSYSLNSTRESSAFIGESVVSGFVHVPSGAVPAAFDRDEVADPDLYIEQGVLRVLFAGRRGTRWSIGTLVASADATKFAPSASAPFEGSGVGFDALGAAAPELVVLPDGYRFYYLGTDGVRRRIGLATQPR